MLLRCRWRVHLNVFHCIFFRFSCFSSSKNLEWPKDFFLQSELSIKTSIWKFGCDIVLDVEIGCSHSFRDAVFPSTPMTMSKVSHLSASAARDIQQEVTKRLLSIVEEGKGSSEEEGAEDDSESELKILTEYVWHLLSNGEADTRSLLLKELKEFLNDHTEAFVDWLLNTLDAHSKTRLDEKRGGVEKSKVATQTYVGSPSVRGDALSGDKDCHAIHARVKPPQGVDPDSPWTSSRSRNRDDDRGRSLSPYENGHRHDRRRQDDGGCCRQGGRTPSSSRQTHRSSRSLRHSSSRREAERRGSSRRHGSRESSPHRSSCKSGRSPLREKEREYDRDREAKPRGRILELAMKQVTKNSSGMPRNECSRSRSRSRSIDESSRSTDAKKDDNRSGKRDSGSIVDAQDRNELNASEQSKVKAILKPNPRFTIPPATPAGPQTPIVVMYGAPTSVSPMTLHPGMTAIPFHPQQHLIGQSNSTIPFPTNEMEIDPMQEMSMPIVTSTAQNASVSSEGSSLGQIRKKCTRWPDCPFGAACLYIHPSAKCKNWPACPFGPGCFYFHPNVPCKYGSSCQNEFCNYAHVIKGDTTAQPDFFGERSAVGGLFKNKTWTSNIENESTVDVPIGEKGIPESAGLKVVDSSPNDTLVSNSESASNISSEPIPSTSQSSAALVAPSAVVANTLSSMAVSSHIQSLQAAVTSLSSTLPGTPPELKKATSPDEIPSMTNLPPAAGDEMQE